MKNETDFRKTVETGAVWNCACPIVLLLNQSNNWPDKLNVGAWLWKFKNTFFTLNF